MRYFHFLKNPNATITLRAIFGLCGLIAYDPALQHAELRWISDSLRALFGGIYCPDKNWDVKCGLQKLSQEQVCAAKYLLHRALVLSREESVCNHCIPISDKEDSILLKLTTDASQYGGAYVVYAIGKDNDPIMVAAAAWSWRAREHVYHSNRKELIAVHKGIQFLSAYFQHLEEVRLAQHREYSVQICCDNNSDE